MTDWRTFAVERGFVELDEHTWRTPYTGQIVPTGFVRNLEGIVVEPADVCDCPVIELWARRTA